MQESNFNEVVAALKGRVNILSTVSSFINLKKKGNKYWGCCPFHNEKTASFTVSEEKNFYYCFGCHEGGDVFNFLMKIRQMSFSDVIKDLAEQYNIPLNDTKNPKEKVNPVEIGIVQAYTLAVEFYKKQLQQSGRLNNFARSYLAKRKISSDTIDKFAIGLSPDDWQELYNYLKAQGINDEILKAAGLVGVSRDGRLFDKFRKRIIIPIFNLKGQAVAFGGRVLTDEDNPKYLNSQESVVFIKRKLLYALNLATNDIRKAGYAIVTEGYMDAISMHAAGIANTVASLGTAFAAEQARLLGRFSKKVLFAYDNDTAGIKATIRAIDIARANFLQPYVINLAPAKDPDEFLNIYGADKMHERIQAAQDGITFQIEQTIKDTTVNTLQDKINLLNTLLEFVLPCENSLEISNYLDIIAKSLIIEAAVVQTEYNKRSKKTTAKVSYSPVMPMTGKLNAVEQAQRHIIKIILEDASVLEYVTAQLLPEDFLDEVLAEIFLFIQVLSVDGVLSEQEMLDKLNDKAKSCFLAILAEDIEFGDTVKFIDDCIRQIKYHKLQKTYEEHANRAIEFERSGDERFINELKIMQDIKQKLTNYIKK